MPYHRQKIVDNLQFFLHQQAAEGSCSGRKESSSSATASATATATFSKRSLGKSVDSIGYRNKLAFQCLIEIQPSVILVARFFGIPESKSSFSVVTIDSASHKNASRNDIFEFSVRHYLKVKKNINAK